jgi:hypothetical protein
MAFMQGVESKHKPFASAQSFSTPCQGCGLDAPL